ncbi:hypothetical protein BG011_004124 [Mortierella polycephala]|uniref:Mid2 domain-containing protein n=1 Tax=Mortierella polycephala TaxID=41804 RepID=A0A9P6QG11_9FUNG|nr:hypothetical protein BG011_004124 [Mortierella polycephala]
MIMRTTTVVAATAILAILSGQTHAQYAPPTNPPPPPTAQQTVNILYSIDANNDVGAEDARFNACFASNVASKPYTYLTFGPKNATINFYKDSDCQEFTFALDGYYGTYPGPAMSFRWVGWSEDYQGEFFDKEPFQGQGDAADGADGGADSPPPGTENPGNDKDKDKDKDKDHSGNGDGNDNGGNHDETSTSSIFSTFFGGVIGTLAVLAIGGVVFWKQAGKKMIDEKGKSVLPYNRVDGDEESSQDHDILLTTKNRSDHDQSDDLDHSFEITNLDDVDKDMETDMDNDHHEPPLRPGRQDRYYDDDQV